MPHILITLGDPAGIGPEIVAKALSSGQLPEGFTFEVIGDASGVTLGKPDERSAQAALAALEEAAQRLKAGTADAVVTAPVAKEPLQRIGFPFPGQTEFFADRLGTSDIAMCLTGDTLTVALVTIHVPLAEVPSLLSREEIVRVGKLLASFLRQRGIPLPKIAVAGLNPHAGEGGAFGQEEQTIIAPAIIELNKDSQADFSGPHVPDAIFRDAARGHYHAVLCMYHDQGLIPLKLLDFDSGVNVTLGLPKPRTSPDHGTAYGIAGQNIASPASMIRAIQVACDLASC